MEKKNTLYPIFYSPSYNHGKLNSNETENSSQDSRKTNVNKNMNINSLARFIKGPPTYLFDPNSVDKPKNELLHEENIEDTKIVCTTDLLTYPELAISRGNLIAQNSTKHSHFPNVPSVKDDDRIHCICHKKSSKLPMAMCSICNCWSHLLCYNISEDKIPDIFVCIYCQHGLVQSIKKQINLVLEPLKESIGKQYEELLSIESQAIKCSKDLMIQINGVPQLSQIQTRLNGFVENSHNIWTEILEVRDQLEKIMTSFVWEKALEDMETYDEETESQSGSNDERDSSNEDS
ncbi:hypothetical protein TRFO_11330 [Tritrichomonas foetus]|uniref:Zinc finger PHD-type domain-containing protein n=1 Tax=Tritrichomonas foetus TaxID=1144522 RepID=A0A1J4J4D6_9EUKA|nr:hypothetical protein TRFO_11330 [Tritrichomonas foetus]|eukprot:OHS94240.1 hypothetical protein TRFO_11330 [Tritrichomonas foetus]